MRKYLGNLKKIYRKIFEYKILCLLYLVIIVFILILTVKNHRKQDLEQFKNYEFKNKFVQYSKCKKDCVIKHEDPEKAKACKKYCKCKKTCASSLNSKKCLKGCKELKMNIYREDENKYQKLKLKKEIKEQNKKDKKEEKIKLERERIKKEKELQKEKESPRTKGFLVDVMNRYASEKDKEFLLNMTSSTSRIYKDLRNIFRVK